MQLWKQWWFKSGIVVVVSILAFAHLTGYSHALAGASTQPVTLLLSLNSDGTLYYDDLPPADGTAENYVIGVQWNKNPVTYSFLNCPARVDCSAAYAAVRQGVEAWDAVSGITLNEVATGGDIQIGWFTYNHGDGNLFDGPGDILAHAFFPASYLGSLAGDMHLDDDENWALGSTASNSQVHLTTVAMHEIGHSLGLDHTGDPGALMWAEYTGVRQLGPDDIAGIQAIYGPPNADDGVAPPPPPAPTNPTGVTATTTTAVRFRTGPGTDYASLTTLPANVTVPVLGRNADASWVYVDYNGTRGWLAAWLCTFNAGLESVPVVNADGTGAAPAPPAPVPPDNPRQPTEPLPPGTVTVESTVNVRIRQGPDTGYTQIGTLPANTTVAVVGRTADNSWLYIEYGSIRGWVAGWLMTITGNLNTIPVVDVNGNPVPYSEGYTGHVRGDDSEFGMMTTLLRELAGDIM